MNGNPGASDASTLTGNPSDDQDGDELNALLEHAFGTSDLVQNKAPVEVTTIGSKVRATVQVNQGADDIAIFLDSSTDLAAWGDASAELPLSSRTNNGDGTATLVFESVDGFLDTTPRLFVRVGATVLP